jgi:hypothetical protein
MAKRERRSIRKRREDQKAQQQRRRVIIAVAVVGVVVLGVALVLLRQAETPVEEVVLPDSLSPPPGADGNAWGAKDAPVLIEEFSDFQ